MSSQEPPIEQPGEEPPPEQRTDQLQPERKHVNCGNQ